jgi:ribonuclease-3
MVTSDQLSETHKATVRLCEERLGYRFDDPTLIVEAVTHSSFADTRLNSYERMEFLGDSVLGFVVCDYLFHEFPDYLEGDLTKIKSNVVSRRTCAKIGREMKLEELLVVGKGVGSSTGQVPASLLANVFESIVGAIFLDGGVQAAREFLMPFVIRHVEEANGGGLDINYKSQLQQYAQKRFGLPPFYQLLDDCGPDHSKWFNVSARVDKKTFSAAWGKNKKVAEQRAAANALAELAGQSPPFLRNHPNEDD